jgi:two-component system cell cycle sensor histidine kinase/response regulator CckA
MISPLIIFLYAPETKALLHLFHSLVPDLSDVCPSQYQIGLPIVGSKWEKADHKTDLVLPISGTPKSWIAHLGVPFGTPEPQYSNMNAATPFPWQEPTARENARTNFCAVFEHAPIAVARCNSQGVIVEVNRTFERMLNCDPASERGLRLSELVRPQDWAKTELLLRELLDSKRDSICLQARNSVAGQGIMNWTAWRLPSGAGDPDDAVLFAEPDCDVVPAAESLLQTQRWEAVGRLAGGVVHDFNNLLTGVMLYCDLLLSSLDSCDHRRRYADEIRCAIVQATGLVRQLLVFARPQAVQTRVLNLNEIAEDMQALLTRLIGENIVLELNLAPELVMVKIDRAQAQQIFLNLVLNARDALPDGGRITVETSNCKFQPLGGGATLARSAADAFPCVLLVVGDNGHGMDAKTRQRLFEPFFTTKSSGKGTGLGLTTVRGIVTTNRGLIHLESEPGRGTRVMILLPRASQSADAGSPIAVHQDSRAPAPTTFQQIKKESIL